MIVIVDYGLSNLLSIKRAVDLFEKKNFTSNDPDQISKADKVILPGVGAFRTGMDQLDDLGISQAITELVHKGVPLLGICLGMQMLFEDSEEGGLRAGLGLIPGHVVKIPDKDVDGERQNVPHIGWERLRRKNDVVDSHSLLYKVPLDGEVYFVHSYEGRVAFEDDLAASFRYGGRDICAMVQKDNVVGCQFHPEKSGTVGLSILSNFVRG